MKCISKISLSIFFIAGLCQSAHAVTVDIYQHMESGNPGDLLTSEIMDSSSHGGIDTDGTWELTGSMWVSANNVRQLPGSVTVNGTDYNISSTRTWMVRDKYALNNALILFGSLPRNGAYLPYHDRITIACYYTPGQDQAFWNQHDMIIYSCDLSFGVMQCIGDYINSDGKPRIRAHSATDGWVTTFSPTITVESNKTYWVNLHHDGPAGVCKVAVFDPDNGYAQVDSTVTARSVVGSRVRSMLTVGRGDNHGDNNSWGHETYSYFSHLLIDYTNAVFPLLPDSSGSGIPTQINLQPKHPKLFYRTTTINYSVTQAGNVKLFIYDKLGREIKVLVDEYKTVGLQSVQWDGMDKAGKKVSSGTYFYQIRLENGDASAKKMIFLR